MCFARFLCGRTMRRLAAAALMAAFAAGLAACAPTRITGMGTDAGESGSVLGARVARTAVTQIGKPYRSGGASPAKGFDCSGLIYWAFAQNGISVPRITTDQAHTGTDVPRHRLQPGDIVVFRAPSGPNGLHTGIYTGQGKFVHSPNRKASVRQDNLDEPHWAKTYKAARRPVSLQAGR